VSVIFAGGGAEPVLAAKAATSKIPIVGAVTVTKPVLQAATASALLLLGLAPTSAGSSSRYEGYSRSAYLPYLNAPSPVDDLTEVPLLRISFGERSYDVMMDTGSTGVAGKGRIKSRGSGSSPSQRA
jgi:hypothetical protein